MNRTHKIRIYPTREQEVLLRKTAGTSRYVYNWALATWKRMYEDFDNGVSREKPNAYLLSRKWTTERPEWSKETNRGSQTKAIMNVGKAFQNLWKGHTNYPTFHKKGRGDGFYVDNQHATILGSFIRLPNIGHVRLAESLRLDGKIMSYSVSTYAGQWHVSVQVETAGDPRPPCSNPASIVGIDVGISHLATVSDGTVLDAPASLGRLDVKLRRAQRALARSQRNSRNRAKLLVRKQKIQNKINNIRHDVTHKFTTAVAKSHGTVVVEDLHVQDMKEKAQYRSLRRSFNSSCMSEILRQLSYKVQVLRKVDRYFPSSKTCSACGALKDSLDLGERTYRCGCGAVIDRDLNAAINLMNSGTVSPIEPVETAVYGCR